MEVPKFKENVLIYVTMVIKVRDLVLTLNNNNWATIPKMNKHRLLILINTSYMTNYAMV